MPAARPRLWRRIGWTLALLVVLAALVPALALTLLYRFEAPLPWLLSHVPGLSIEGWKGRLAEGRITAARLHWHAGAGAGELVLEGVAVEPKEIEWRLDGTRPLRIALLRVSVQRARWSSGSRPAAPPVQPPHLRLPLTLAIDELVLSEGAVDRLPALSSVRAAVHLGDDDGRQHRFELHSARLLDWALKGQARIATDGKLELAAELDARPPAGAQGARAAAQAHLRAAGPLATLRVGGEVRDGDLAAIQLDAELRPFESWPLPRLALSSRELDLQAIDARLPRTRIEADAALRLSGWNRPAEGMLSLSNAVPGAFDAGSLPLRQARLRIAGRPDRAEPFAIEALEVALGDARDAAGRIAGSGRWAGHRLQLDLQLQQIRPARLDSRLPALDLSGSWIATVDGLPRPDGAAAPGAWSASGSVQLRGQAGGLTIRPFALAAQFGFDAGRTELRQVAVNAGGDRLSGELFLRRQGDRWSMDSQGDLAIERPLAWWPAAAGHPQGALLQRAQGRWQLAVQAPWPLPRESAWDAMAGRAELALDGTRLADAALTAQLNLHAAQPGQWAGTASASWAGNRASAELQRVPASSGGSAQRLNAQWQLDAPQRLAAWIAHRADWAPWWPGTGRLQGQLIATRGGAGWQLQAQARADSIASAALRLKRATLALAGGSQADAPLKLDLMAEEVSLGPARQPQRLDRIAAVLDGGAARHALSLSVESPLRPPAWSEHLLGDTGTGTRLQATGTGRFERDASGARWDLSELALALRARREPPAAGAGAATGTAPSDWLAGRGLAARLRFDPDLALRELRFAPGRVSLPSTGLAWSEASWTAAAGPQSSSRLKLEAVLDAIQAAKVLQRLQPEQGWLGDLTLGGHIAIDAAERFQAEAVLERERGDLALRDEAAGPQALGLSELRLAFSARDGQWQFAQGLAGDRIGEMATAVVLSADPRARWPAPQSAVQGVMQARVGQLAAWGAWIPPGWRLDGELSAGATLGGRLDALQFTGRLGARGVSLRNPVHGVYLSDGELELKLEGERATLEHASVRGGDGRLSLEGSARLGEQPQAQLRVNAERFRLLGRLDRRIVASGAGELVIQPQRVQASGRFTVDEGLFDFSHADAPALDDDVDVRRPGRSGESDAALGARSAWQAQLDLGIDLGSRLKLRGRGLDTGLRGSLRITSPANRLALNGNVRARGGTYQAYGQRMEIERGEVVFTGAPDAARLDVLAIRPNLDIKVGVAVSGTPASPRIRLVSEPEMPEFDKLAWLVLGRGPDELGRTDTALIQRAAVALLAGEGAAPGDSLLGAIGLTDFSVRQSEGDVRETVISLGRQLSRRWYVGYERSLNATLGTWQLVYRSAQRFRLRAQWGSENAVDAIWSWRWQ